MARVRYTTLFSFLVFMLSVYPSHAQDSNSDVYWRIDPSVKSCSMNLDPSLTQGQWHTFIRQVGAASSFKTLSSASTLGRMRFRIAVDYTSTPVDQHDPAWINTFVHPDEDCPLGDAVVVPTVRAALGITDNMDIGGYWTTAPNANYGMVGAEYKFAFLRETETAPAMAARASATFLTGVPDFDLNIYSIEVMTGKTFSGFSPYLGIRTNLAVGTETTTKVDLRRENVSLVQGYGGITYSIWMLHLAAEYNISAVNSLAFAIGMVI